MNFWNPDLNEKLLQWNGTYNWCASSLNARSIAYTFGHVVWNRTWLKADAFFTHRIIYSKRMEALLHTRWTRFEKWGSETKNEAVIEWEIETEHRQKDRFASKYGINIKYPFGLFRIFWFNEIIMDLHIDKISKYTRTARYSNASPFFKWKNTS